MWGTPFPQSSLQAAPTTTSEPAPWAMELFVISASRSKRSVSYGASIRLSSLVSRRMRTHEFVFRAGQRELKYRAPRLIHIGPQPARMGIDDRPTDRQSHSHSAGFRGVKCIEHALEMRRIDARPGIAHCHKDASVVLFGADQQLSCPCLNRAHCFDRVQEQVQDHLLQLNAIAVNGK